MVSPVIPVIQYQDATAAIDFLVTAFGFDENAAHMADDGTVEHAQLTFGTGMVMLGSARESDPAHGSVSIYVIVDDADAHHARAVAGGAEIVTPVEDQDYGARLYTARDPEGNDWSFGTYRPNL
jgi:uncharacterized glyoxalase superfamily protein PhnB